MKNSVYVFKDVYKAINKLKKANERLYKKIIKEIAIIEKNKIKRLEKYYKIYPFENIGENVYLYIIDDILSFIIVLHNKKIYIMDLIEMKDDSISSVLINLYESKIQASHQRDDRQMMTC